MYTSAIEMILRFEPNELAQIAVPDHLVSISAELLQSVASNDDVSAYPSEEVESATYAVERINKVIVDATGEIDTYLGGRYQLPLSTVSMKIRNVCSDIARYMLYDDHATDHIRQRYEDAIHFLRMVSKGQIQLGIDESNAETEPESDTVEFTESKNTFDRDNSGSFI